MMQFRKTEIEKLSRYECLDVPDKNCVVFFDKGGIDQDLMLKAIDNVDLHKNLNDNGAIEIYYPVEERRNKISKYLRRLYSGKKNEDVLVAKIEDDELDYICGNKRFWDIRSKRRQGKIQKNLAKLVRNYYKMQGVDAPLNRSERIAMKFNHGFAPKAYGFVDRITVGFPSWAGFFGAMYSLVWPYARNRVNNGKYGRLPDDVL